MTNDRPSRALQDHMDNFHMGHLSDFCATCQRLLDPPEKELSPLAITNQRQIIEALGFDPTNHHNAAKCPYCSPVKEGL